MAKRWSKADMIAKYQDRVAKQATKHPRGDRYDITSRVPGKPSMGNHVRSVTDDANLQVRIAQVMAGVMLEIDVWKDRTGLSVDDPDAAETWVTVRIVGKADDASDPLWYNSAPKIVVYEGPLNYRSTREMLNRFSRQVVDRESHHMLTASTPDDPFYMDEEDVSVAWANTW